MRPIRRRACTGVRRTDMPDYRVQLDVYQGPVDLLLYLIRRQEVEIEEVSLSELTRQYLAFLDLLAGLELEPAADFLVVAATLMEIKSEAILPQPPQEQQPTENPTDPRMELVRQLLMYKRFKDAARLLDGTRDLFENRFPRPAQELPTVDPTAEGADLMELEVWDLLKAFARVMEDLGVRGPAAHEVEYLDTPIEVHARNVRRRLESEGPLTLHQLIEGITLRREIIGVFCALLELVKQRVIVIEQRGPFGEIRVRLRPAGEQGLSAAAVGTGPTVESPGAPETGPQAEPIEYAEAVEEPGGTEAGRPDPACAPEAAVEPEPTAAGRFDDIDPDLLDDEIDAIVVPDPDFAELRA